MIEEMDAEVDEAELGGLYQIADKGQRVPEDAPERGARLLDVGQRAGLHHIENDLQEIPDRGRAPRHEPLREPAEHPDELGEGARNQDDVRDVQGLERLDEEAWYLADEAQQRGERALEPCE